MKNSNIVVLKFGGTSMGTADSIKSCASIIIDKIKKGKKPFVVVSALSKMTDNLLKLLNLARSGKNKELGEFFIENINRHYDILNELIVNEKLCELYTNILGERFKSLARIFDGISLVQDYSEKMQANVLSYGEELSSLILEAYLLQNDINCKQISSSKLIKVNGDYLSGDVDFKKTKTCFNKIKKEVENGTTFVMTGFFGSNSENEITLLGRGGSDFSASVAGISLEANSVEIWTDVDGVMSADPRIVKKAKSWEKINKDVASEMARAGAKVLHPKTILAAYYDIDLIIKNTFNQSFKGTLVNNETCGNGVKGIASDDNYSILHLENEDMFGNTGFVAEIGLIASEHNIPLDMTTTSETSVSFTIKSNLLNDNVKKVFDSIANFKVIENTTKISIIGENIASNNILELIFKSLKKENIEPLMVSMGQSKNNIGIVINTENKEKALTTLHKALVEDKY